MQANNGAAGVARAQNHLGKSSSQPGIQGIGSRNLIGESQLQAPYGQMGSMTNKQKMPPSSGTIEIGAGPNLTPQKRLRSMLPPLSNH